MANCTKCGHILPETVNFCENCGAKVEMPTQDTAPINTEQTMDTAHENFAPENNAQEEHFFEQPPMQGNFTPVNSAQNTQPGDVDFNNEFSHNTNYAQGNQQSNYENSQGANYNIPTSMQSQPMKKNYMLFGLVAVVLIVIVVAIGVMLSSMMSGLDDYGIAAPDINLFSDDEQSEPIGMYTLSSMTMLDMEFAYVDLLNSGDISSYNFKENGEVEFITNSETHPIELDRDAQTLTLFGRTHNYYFDGDNFITTNMQDLGMVEYVYTAENSPNWDEIMDEDSALDARMEEFFDFEAPGYGAVETRPVFQITNPSDWYGSITINYIEGENAGQTVEHEAWGYINTSSDGKPYFEIYANDIYDGEYPLVSFFIEMTDLTFSPIIDDDAWIFDAPLDEDRKADYEPELILGVLSATYPYDYNGEVITLEYYLSQIDD